MRKTLKIGMLASLLAVMLFAGLASSVSATSNGTARQGSTAQQPLEEMLVGTWRWVNINSYILVFRPDGTGASGFPGLRIGFVWSVVDGRLFVDGVDQNIRVDGNMITLDRLNDVYTYRRYSDATDISTDFTALIVIGVIVLVLIVGTIVLVVVLVSRSARRSRQHLHRPYYPPRPPGPPQPPHGGFPQGDANAGAWGQTQNYNNAGQWGQAPSGGSMADTSQPRDDGNTGDWWQPRKDDSTKDWWQPRKDDDKHSQ